MRKQNEYSSSDGRTDSAALGKTAFCMSKTGRLYQHSIGIRRSGAVSRFNVCQGEIWKIKKDEPFAESCLNGLLYLLTALHSALDQRYFYHERHMVHNDKEVM